MSEYVGVVTAVGQQKIAAATGGAALNLTTIRVGDGNGAPIAPHIGMTDLVRRVGAAYPIVSSGRDPVNLTHWRVTALIPAGDGPFDIREIGVFDAAGDMIAIAKHVLVEKRSPAQGAAIELTTDIVFPVSETAQVTVQIQPSAAVSVLQMLRAGFCAVESAQLANPPANPPLGATYVVPAGATGAWAGLTGRLVQWTGIVWVSIDPPPGFVVVAQDLALDHAERWLRRAAGGWVSARAAEDALGVVELASAAEVLAGVDATRAVTPASLSARVASETVAGLVRKATPAEVRSRAAVAAYISPDQTPGLNRIVDATSAAVTVTAADAGTLFYQFGTQTTTFTLRPCTELAPAIAGAGRGCAFFGFSNNNGTGDVIVRMTAGGGSICGLLVAGPQTSLTLRPGESITMLCDGSNVWVTWVSPSVEGRIRQSRAGTGYQVLPGGLVDMWGSSLITTDVAGNSAIALPIVCPGGVLSVVAYNGDSSANPQAIISEYAAGYPTTGAIAIHASNASGGAFANATMRVRWRAMGAL